MKKSIISIILLFVFSNICLAQKISLFDELLPLYPDTKINVSKDSIVLHMARGSIAGINILLKNLSDKDKINVHHNLDEFFTDVDIFELLDVPVEENTGLDSRTEQYKGDKNPYVIRKAPFRVYEILKPIQLPKITLKKTQAFHIRWKLPYSIKPGTYHTTLNITGFDFTKTLEIISVVYKTKVPPTSFNTYKYTNWFSINNIASYHNVEKWSESFWNIVHKYAVAMVEGRQNVFWIQLTQMFDNTDTSNPVLNTKRLKKYIQAFTKAGMYYMEFCPIARRTKNDWLSKTLSSSFNEEILVNSKEGYSYYEKIFKQLKFFIDKNHWQERSLFHISDEPTDEVVEDYKIFVKHFKKYFFNAPILEATMTLKLSNVVNNWCPQVQEFQKYKKFFKKKKKQKDKIWIYTCLIPGGKWLNRLLDQHKLRQVYIGWSLARFDLEGYLHWGLNHYNTPNPFVKSVVDHPQMPKTKNKLPAGDTHIFYPGVNEPWISLRFNAHRIGLEDAELFKQLKLKQRKKIMYPCFENFDTYKTDISLYRAAKKKLLETIDKTL